LSLAPSKKSLVLTSTFPAREQHLILFSSQHQQITAGALGVHAYFWRWDEASYLNPIPDNNEAMKTSSFK